MDLHRANVPLGSILRWNVDHAGYLTQPSGKGLRRTWKRRYYVLKGSRLFYFRSDDEEEPVEGMLDLDMYASVEATSQSGKKGKWGVMMRLKGPGGSGGGSTHSSSNPDSPALNACSSQQGGISTGAGGGMSPRMSPASPTPSSGAAPFFARRFTSTDSGLSSSPPSNSPSPLYLTPSSSGAQLGGGGRSPVASPTPSMSEVMTSCPGTPVPIETSSLGKWEAYAEDEEARDRWVALLKSRLVHFDTHILDTVLNQLDYGKYMRKRNPSNPSVPSVASNLTAGMRMGAGRGHSPTLSSSASTSSLTSLASQASRRSTSSSTSSSSSSSSSVSSSTLTGSPSRKEGMQKSSPLTHNTPPSSPPLSGDFPSVKGM
ncbi:hypothetical protein BJ684DRAFT_20525, partial [Piptocephalis cylindrospora]